MKRSCAFLAAFLVVAASATTAGAISDHLQCLKIKDTTAKLDYTADITPSDLTFAAAAGCTIKVPAKLLCVDAAKSNVTPTPPGADDGNVAQKYLCYKAKCPKDQPTATVTDQFGTHAITVKGTSLVCAPVPVAASCSDAMQNGGETGVDCGGGSCPTCGNGQGCAADSDCTSSFCSGGLCANPPATCSDAIQNGGETGVDCGGGTCPTCGIGQGCLIDGDCANNNCVGGLCATPTCSDGIKNGNETGVDCGGGTCPTCSAGQGCVSASDCTSNLCSMGVCQSLLMNGSACSFAGQCGSSNCVDGFCCDGPCAGLCQACSAAKKGSGTDGSCGNIVTMSDPDDECVGTQTCDGSGACQP